MAVESIPFEDRVVLVTGGGQGIGFACGAAFAEGGAKVVLADLDGDRASAAAAKLSPEALGLQVDVSRRDSVQRMVRRVIADFRKIDVLVHSAAVSDSKTFLESSPDDWDRVIGVGLYGAMLCLHEVLPHMVGAGYGRVVCIGTDAGRTGQAGLSYYAAAKAGMTALVKSVAQEVGRSGVTLNVVSPGATNTPQRNEREALFQARLGEERYAARTQKIVRRYPLGRLGEPDDIAGVVAFLGSDKASWITGQVLSVNGGFVMP